MERLIFDERVTTYLFSYYHPFTSWAAFKYTIFHFIPILDWLPKYNWKQDFVYDLIGGLTVGIVHIPNGFGEFYNFN